MTKSEDKQGSVFPLFWMGTSSEDDNDVNYDGIEQNRPPLLSDEEYQRREEAQRHVLRLSREGQIEEVRQIMKSDEYLHVDWTGAMFEAAFSKTPPPQRKKMLWTLSERYAGCPQLREEFCSNLLEMGGQCNN